MIGDKISFYRSSRRYTQEHMARKLGISQKSYSNIENNTKKPTEKELELIAAELGVTKEAIKNPVPVIIINDSRHNANVGNNTIEHQQLTIDKELLQNIINQVNRKDGQLEKLITQNEKILLQVERLLALLKIQ